MNRQIFLSMLALLWATSANHAAASIQMKTVTRGVSTDLATLENAVDRSTSAFASHTHRPSPKDRGIYYFEMTHSQDNLTRCSYSYTLLGKVNENRAVGGKARAHWQSSASTPQGLVLSSMPQPAWGGQKGAWNSSFGNEGSRNVANHGVGRNSFNSHKPAGSKGPVSGQNLPNVHEAISNSPAQATVTSSSVEAYVRPPRGNGSDEPVSVVPELSAIVVWAMLSPFGAMALTSRRSRRTR